MPTLPAAEPAQPATEPALARKRTADSIVAIAARLDEQTARFRKLSQLDAGPDGVVYEALDVQADDAHADAAVRWCELSALRASARWPEQSARLRICRLARSRALQLILQLDLATAKPWVVLRPQSASTFATFLGQETSLTPRDAVRLAHVLAEAVAEMHRLGLVHGCLCPSAIGMQGLEFQLDPSGLQLSSEKVSVPAMQYRAVEADAAFDTPADVFALARLIRDLLGSISTPNASGQCADTADIARQQSTVRAELLEEFGCAPLLAQLQQLLRQASVDDPFERPTAEQLASCLASISRSPGQAAPRDDSESAALAATSVTCDEPFAQPLQAGDLAGDTSGDPAGVPLSRAFARELQIGEVIGKYRVEAKLGEGGMGTVYRAIDQGSDQAVALKVLSPAYASRPQSLARFLKEARLLATINNPHVTNLIEVNQDRGLHYIAMELVQGINLEIALSTCGPLSEPVALSLVADVAKALVDAHDRGIVHRDIKPANVLLACEITADAAGGLPVAEIEQIIQQPCVKLSDFGLARHVEQSESLAMTRAGAILGTPLYMAPEQCAGTGEISPQTDVYALGVMLFELLTGRTPFVADDPLKLAALHRFEPAPSVRKLNPQLSEATAQLVAKTLAKQPTARHASAGHLLRDLTQLIRGEAAEVALHPRLPQHNAANLCQAEWVWELSASPAQLWPYVSNTERINRAAGVPPVQYETRRDQERGLHKFGAFRLAGLNIAWEEHPFEWVEGQRMRILREFTQGPFRWFQSTVDLEALPSGGTRLRHGVQIEPRGWLGRLVSLVEVKLKGSRALDRIYRRIDALVSGQTSRGVSTDAFELPAVLPSHAQARLSARVRGLVQRGVAADLAEMIGDYLAHAPAQELGHIRSMALAERLGRDADETLSACLLAAAEGLLVLRWDILCPTCRVAADVQQTLKAIAQHGYCEACDLDFELDFSKSVELLFCVHPEIRAADVGTYCIGGPEHSPHVVAQLRIDPQEQLELELELPEGEYLLRGPQLVQQVSVLVRAGAGPSHAAIELAAQIDSRHVCLLRRGKQLLSLTNALPRQLLVRLERAIARQDVVTAAQAASLAVFRELFPDQLLGTENLMSLETVTLLTTQVAGVDALYNSLGDAGACSLLRQHFQLLEAQVRREGGAVIKFVGEGILASFNNCAAALRAALRLQSALQTEESTSALRLRVGLHSGPALVATLNDRLDYLGATARTASLLSDHAHPGELVVTEAVTSDPAAAAVLKAYGPAGALDEVCLGGCGPLAVTRITLAQMPAF